MFKHNVKYYCTRFQNLKHTCLSHKSGIALQGYSKIAFGLDMEVLQKRDFKAHLEFCFNTYERHKIQKSPQPLEEFYRIWTIKESLVKFCHQDLSYMDKVGLDEKGTFYEKMSKKIYTQNHTFKYPYQDSEIIISVVFKHQDV